MKQRFIRQNDCPATRLQTRRGEKLISPQEDEVVLSSSERLVTKRLTGILLRRIASCYDGRRITRAATFGSYRVISRPASHVQFNVSRSWSDGLQHDPQRMNTALRTDVSTRSGIFVRGNNKRVSWCLPPPRLSAAQRDSRCEFRVLESCLLINRWNMQGYDFSPSFQNFPRTLLY